MANTRQTHRCELVETLPTIPRLGPTASACTVRPFVLRIHAIITERPARPRALVPAKCGRHVESPPTGTFDATTTAAMSPSIMNQALTIGHGHASHPDHDRVRERSGFRSEAPTETNYPCPIAPRGSGCLTGARWLRDRYPFRSTATAASAVGAGLRVRRPNVRAIR
jgi:hypothetical protein